MTRGRPLALLLALSLAWIGVPAHAGTGSTPTFLTIDAAPQYADLETSLVVTLTTTDTPVPAPIGGATLRVSRIVAGTSTQVAVLVTDEDGRAEVPQTLSRVAEDNDYRAYFDGDDTHEATYTGVHRAVLRRHQGVIELHGPRQIAAGEPLTLHVRWSTDNGLPVEGQFLLRRRKQGQGWENQFRRARTDEEGRASLTLRPRVDTRWRVGTPVLDWVRFSVSHVLWVDTVRAVPRRTSRRGTIGA